MFRCLRVAFFLGATALAASVQRENSDLLEWVLSQGGFVKFEIEISEHESSHQKFVVARENIPKDETIFAVPLDAILAPYETDQDPTACDTAWTLVDVYNALVQEGSASSHFAPYIEHLLDLALQSVARSDEGDDLLPMNWSPEGINWMFDLVGGEMPQRDFHNLGLFLDACYGDDIEEGHQESVRRIVSLVQARGWNSNFLIPVYDLIQDKHQFSYQDHQENMVRVECDVIDSCQIVAERDIRAGEAILNKAYNRLEADEHLFDLHGNFIPYPHRWTFETGHGLLEFELHKNSSIYDQYQVTWLSEQLPSLQERSWLLAHQKRLRGIHNPKLQNLREQSIAMAYLEALTTAVDQALLWAQGDPYSDLNVLLAVDHKDRLTIQQPEISGQLLSSSNIASSLVPNMISQSSPSFGKCIGCAPNNYESHVLSAKNTSAFALWGGLNLSVPTRLTTGARSEGNGIKHKGNQNYFDSLASRLSALNYNEGEVSPFCDSSEFDEQSVIKDRAPSFYQDIEWEHYFNTKINKDDTCLFLDGYFHSCTSVRPHVHETIIHYPASFVDEVKRVLYVGGGDVIILHEILKYPSLELVIGMELDQAVVRSSFRHYGVQPHFDSDKVHWWFGDASKSLTLLSEEYFGTFDLVVIDLLTFVFDSLRVGEEGEMLVDYMMKLLKPDGVMARQEDFLERNVVDFAKYTVDLDISGLLHLCQQSITLGSNGIDFTRKKPVDHNIDTIVYKAPGSIGYHYTDIWSSFRRNNRQARTSNCVDSGDLQLTETEPKLDTVQRSFGVLVVVEAENVTIASLEDPKIVHSVVEEALEESGFTNISAVQSFSANKTDTMTHVFIFVMKEGYVVARTWPENNYIALDLHLWNHVAKHEAAVAKLMAAFGAEESKSSFKITTGGMYGSGYGDAKGKIARPTKTSPCSNDWNATTPVTAGPAESYHLDSVLHEMTTLTQTSEPMLVVVCPTDTSACPSLDSLRSTARDSVINRVYAIHFCSNGSEESQDLTICEQATRQNLLHQVSVMAKKIDGIVIDPNAPREMGQIVHKIFNNTVLRMELLAEKFVVLAPTSAMETNADSNWRTALLERFRTDIVIFNPVFHAKVDLIDNHTPSKVFELGIFSAGNEQFYARLLDIFTSIEANTHSRLSLELRNSKVGLMSHVPDFVPQFVASPADYTLEASYEQWSKQHPVGRQTVYQLEIAPKVKFSEEDRVLVNDIVHVWGGTWLAGIILEQRKDGNYIIELSTGVKASVNQRVLRRVIDEDFLVSLEFGEHVLVYSEDDSLWHQGSVEDVNIDGTYRILPFSEPKNPMLDVPRKYLVRRAELKQRSLTPVAMISKAKFISILQEGLQSIMLDPQLSVSVTNLGAGCVVAAMTEDADAQIVASWDGRNHIDINVFILDSSSNQWPIGIATILEHAFVERMPEFSITRIQSDEHPRGFNRVVNNREDLSSHWFGKEMFSTP
ncbi:hypothetical protein ACA910_017953 [Epithemia clementina (nom. ined.)]